MLSKPLKIKGSKNPATVKLLKRLLEKSPIQREGKGINELFKHEYFHQISWPSLLNKKTRPFYHPNPKKKLITLE